MLEAALDKWQKCTHAGLKDLLHAALMLYCLTLVKDNLAWYLQNQVISAKAASELEEAWQYAVKSFAPHVNTAVEGLGLIRPTEYFMPIARDYVAFNAQDNNDCFDSAGQMFDFRTTGMPRAKL